MPNSFPILVGGGGAAASYTAKITGTGQTVSYADYDDAYYAAQSQETDFYTLKENNYFGNKYRFTGITGGYYNQVIARWCDKDGNVTSEVLAIPNDIVLDWNSWEMPTGDVLGWYRRGFTLTGLDWNYAVAKAVTQSVGAFLTGWKMCNRNELVSITLLQAFPLDFPPFNYTSPTRHWMSTSISAAKAYYYDFTNTLLYTVDKTSVGYRYLINRTFNISEL